MANSTVEDLAAYFASCGLASNRALDSAKSKQASTINALFRSNSLETKGLSDKQALLASQVARDGGKLGETERAVVVDAVVDGKLKSSDQVLGQFGVLCDAGAGLIEWGQRRSSISRRILDRSTLQHSISLAVSVSLILAPLWLHRLTLHPNRIHLNPRRNRDRRQSLRCCQQYRNPIDEMEFNSQNLLWTQARSQHEVDQCTRTQIYGGEGLRGDVWGESGGG